MSKCTGKRCPMQVGYDVANCQCEGCSYRTPPKTNYDRIRNMSVEEMAELMVSQIIVTIENVIKKNPDITDAHIEALKKALFRWGLKYLESEVTEE